MRRTYDSNGPITRRGFLKTAVGSTGLLLLAACTPAPSAPAKPSGASKAGETKPSLSSVKILFNVPQDPTFVPDLSAYQRLKDQYGIEADVQEITGADASIKALIAGQAQFALSTLASGILAVGQHQQIKAAIPAASAPYFTFVVPAGLQDWKQLGGKRIGITATSDSSYYTTLLQLRNASVDPGSITTTPVLMTGSSDFPKLGIMGTRTDLRGLIRVG